MHPEMRRKIVLYNPRAVFYTMPLALLAVGSALDPAKYDVRIVDGRLQIDPVQAVLAEIDDAVCLGITVLTGDPIRDALQISRAAKTRRPDLPVVWGGWHPSLFPKDTLAESSIDIAVAGQGEETFAAVVERLALGERKMAGVPGCAWKDASTGEVTLNSPRPLRDMNDFPAADYRLIDVHRFFSLKRARQLDYISSQGCRFRCTFCADPYVYKREWVALEPARVGRELETLSKHYGFHDVGMQDETFFTHKHRVEDIAAEFISRDFPFTWTATMRADQGSRLEDSLLATCRRSGLRRVMIGVESGSQTMLDWMKKDVTIDQVFDTAEKCRRHHIGAIFNIIVGFPGEAAESVDASLRVAKRMRAMSPDFEVAMFYYKPYPGNAIAEMLSAGGYRFPQTLEEWAEFDYVGSTGPWVTPEKAALIEGFKFYQRIAWSRPAVLRAPIQALARWRCARDFYAWPVEKVIAERLKPAPRLS